MLKVDQIPTNSIIWDVDLPVSPSGRTTNTLILIGDSGIGETQFGCAIAAGICAR